MYGIETSDHELISHYLNGNIGALEFLINKHKGKVFTSIVILVKDKYLAEDIFQDTFMKVIDSFHAGVYQEEGKFLPWVMRISHNLCIDYFRKQKRKPIIVDGAGNDVLEYLGLADSNMEELIIKDQGTQTLKNLIKKLPDEQREVLVLRHYAELSFKEISEMTQVSINTALGRMRYALINLRKMMEEQKVQIL